MDVFAGSVPISVLCSVDIAPRGWSSRAAVTWRPDQPSRRTTGQILGYCAWKDHQFHLPTSKNTMVVIKYVEVLNLWWLSPIVSHVPMSISPLVNFHWKTTRILWLAQRQTLRPYMRVTTQHLLTPSTHTLLLNFQSLNINFAKSTWIQVFLLSTLTLSC